MGEDQHGQRIGPALECVLRRKDRGAHPGRDGDSPGRDEPQGCCQETGHDNIVHAYEPRVAFCGGGDGTGDPVQLLPLAGIVLASRGIVQREEHRFDLKGGGSVLARYNVVDSLGMRERHLEIHGADIVGTRVGGEPGGQQGLRGQVAVEGVGDQGGEEDVAHSEAGTHEEAETLEERPDTAYHEAGRPLP